MINMSKECKNCELCDLINNICLIDNMKCYEKGTKVHSECNKYIEGTWTENFEIVLDKDKKM